MLIKESQLYKPSIFEKLDEAVYLTQEEASINCNEIPVVAKEDGNYLVDYYYLNNLSEQTNTPVMQIVSELANANNIDPSSMSIVMDESEVYSNDINFSNLLIRPVNEDSLIYSIMEEACIDFFNEDISEEEFVDLCLSEEVTADQMKKMVEMRKRHIEKAEQKNADERYAANKSFYFGDKSAADAHNEIQAANAKKEKKLKNIDAATDRLYKMKLNKSKREEAEKKANEEKESQSQAASQMQIKDEPDNAPTSKPDSQGEVKNLPAKVESEPAKAAPEKGTFEKVKDFASNNKGKLAAGALGLAAGGAALAAYKSYQNKPKSVIGKKIASLRSIYAKFMKRAQASQDSGIAAKLKRVAAKILSVIDKLMGYLQNKAG
jgi:hypothetical protein